MPFIGELLGYIAGICTAIVFYDTIIDSVIENTHR